MAAASAAALAGSSSNHFPVFKLNPVPNHMRVILGLPDLLPPISAKEKERHKKTRTKRKSKNKTRGLIGPLGPPSYSSKHAYGGA